MWVIIAGVEFIPETNCSRTPETTLDELSTANTTSNILGNSSVGEGSTSGQKHNGPKSLPCTVLQHRTTVRGRAQHGNQVFKDIGTYSIWLAGSAMEVAAKAEGGHNVIAGGLSHLPRLLACCVEDVNEQLCDTPAPASRRDLRYDPRY